MLSCTILSAGVQASELPGKVTILEFKKKSYGLPIELSIVGAHILGPIQYLLNVTVQ